MGVKEILVFLILFGANLLQAITFFEQNAQAGERFKFTIDRVGKEKFEEVIKEAYANG